MKPVVAADGSGGIVSVERLSNLDGWEFYRLVEEDGRGVICTIALRCDTRLQAAEYGVWRRDRDREDPGATGAVAWESSGDGWSDAAREGVLRQIAARHEGDLKVEQGRLKLILAIPLLDESDEEESEDDDGDKKH
jgi:hypothetical protein